MDHVKFPDAQILEANNYNAAANVDDGSCVFLGCTYETACNYDPTASVDDGSCDFISCLTLGCTYPGACNYDATANLDDGSCLEVDCNGVCGGGAVFDECGACDGPGRFTNADVQTSLKATAIVTGTNLTNVACVGVTERRALMHRCGGLQL